MPLIKKPVYAMPILALWLVWFASGLIYLKSHGLSPAAVIENASRLEAGLLATWLVIDITLLAYAIKLIHAKLTSG